MATARFRRTLDMLDLLTAFTRLFSSLGDLLTYLTATGARLGQVAAGVLLAVGVGVTLWTLLRRRPRRTPRPPRRRTPPAD